MYPLMLEGEAQVSVQVRLGAQQLLDRAPLGRAIAEDRPRGTDDRLDAQRLGHGETVSLYQPPIADPVRHGSPPLGRQERLF